MTQGPENQDAELRRLHAEADARERDIDDMDARDIRNDTLIERLRREAVVQAEDFATLNERLAAAEHELEDLRAVRDALTPPRLPHRPGLELAATFIPASADQVSGDFYLVAEGPQESTVLVVGDVVGHGLRAGRRAAFVRTAFAATAPFSDDPSRLLSWANTALIERAGTGSEFVTAACVTYLPHEQLLRWAYAGHPPALSLDDGEELVAPAQGTPLGIRADPGCLEGSRRSNGGGGGGVVLYTDGLTEARHGGQLFGLEGATAALGGLDKPSPTEAIGVLQARSAEFAKGILTDDICLLAARIT
jgi:sigma-B regulation protein RsbU (phosphoserine phosphatase)